MRAVDEMADSGTHGGNVMSSDNNFTVVVGVILVVFMMLCAFEAGRVYGALECRAAQVSK